MVVYFTKEMLSERNSTYIVTLITFSSFISSTSVGLKIRIMLLDHNKLVHEVISTYLQKADLKPEVNATHLTDMIMVFLTGIHQEAKIYDDRNRFSNAIDLIISLI